MIDLKEKYEIDCKNYEEFLNELSKNKNHMKI